MKNFQQIGMIDVMPLTHQLLRQPHLFEADTYMRDYPGGPFGQTDTVYIRFPPASRSEEERATSDPHECVWMDGAIHLPAARKIIFSLMSAIEGERLGRVLVNRLKPGCSVKPHRDLKGHTDHYKRYHVALQTSDLVSMRCDEETVHMPAGSIWWVNNATEHESVNLGRIDRLHLVIDVRLTSPASTGQLPTTSPPP